MADFYREIIKILSAHGFHCERKGKGSHEIWSNPTEEKRVTVPRSTKSRHTANEVLKQVACRKAFKANGSPPRGPHRAKTSINELLRDRERSPRKLASAAL